jgi:hypothetical protein
MCNFGHFRKLALIQTQQRSLLPWFKRLPHLWRLKFLIATTAIPWNASARHSRRLWSIGFVLQNSRIGFAARSINSSDLPASRLEVGETLRLIEASIRREENSTEDNSPDHSATVAVTEPEIGSIFK